jgi:hypothetical protein
MKNLDQNQLDRDLLVAVRNNDADAIKVAVDSGASPLTRRCEPIKMAIKNNSHDLLRFFLAYGFNPNDFGAIAFKTALELEKYDLFELMFKHTPLAIENVFLFKDCSSPKIKQLINEAYNAELV